MRLIDYPRPARALDGSEPVGGWQDGHQVALTTRQIAELATAPAAGSAAAAVAAAAVATQGANDAGGAYAGIQGLITGIPTTAQLPLQATSRATMAGFHAEPAGRQVRLSEGARDGDFIQVTGNMTALVAADPYQAFFVPIDTDATGAAGGFLRKYPGGIAFAEWAGVAGDGAAYHLQINAMLSFPGVTSVLLPAGIVGAARSVTVPTGKSLAGAGRGLTTVKAVNFTFETDAVPPNNQLIRTADGAVGARVSDMTVDGNKTGIGAGDAARIHGVTFVNGANCRGDRLTIKNITGYGAHIAGGSGHHFDDIQTLNCKVHYEATNLAINCSFTNTLVGDGDGDILCEAWRHALNGARNITFRDGAGDGATLNPILVIRNTDADVYGILFENISGSTTNAATLIGTDNVAGAGRRFEYEVKDCHLTSAGGSLVANNGAEAKISGTWLETTGDTGVTGSNAGDITFGDGVTFKLGQNLPDGDTASFWGFDPATHVTLAGEVTFIGKMNGENNIQAGPGQITVKHQPNLDACPTQYITLMGKGHRVVRTLAADDVGPEGRVGESAALGQELAVVATTGSIVELGFRGAIKGATSGPSYALETAGNASLYGGSGSLMTSLDRSTPDARTTFFGASQGYDPNINAVEAPGAAANTPLGFHGDALFNTTHDANGGLVFLRAGAADGGQRTVYATTTLIAEQIA